MAEIFLGFGVLLVIAVFVVAHIEEKQRERQSMNRHGVIRPYGDDYEDTLPVVRHSTTLVTPPSAEAVLSREFPKAALKVLVTQQHALMAREANTALLATALQAKQLDPEMTEVHLSSHTRGNGLFNSDGVRFQGTVRFGSRSPTQSPIFGLAICALVIIIIFLVH